MRIVDSAEMLKGIESGRFYEGSDLIDRITSLPTIFDENAYTQGYKQGICDERADKTGHWCEMDLCSGSTFQCSRCGGEIKSYYKPKFCEFCGADMRGGEKNVS